LTTLLTIREWRNSLVRVNRIPLEILCLVPTYLSSQGDHFRATFVCRHWRRTFLQNGALWSQLFLNRGEVYVKTLLERAKGSTLNIIVNRDRPDGAVALLSPHTRRIGRLEFIENNWTDIMMFSQVNSGPLPLLRTLNITSYDSLNQPIEVTPPSLLLFSNGVNLEKFIFRSEHFRFFSHFIFPNLTTLELSTWPGGWGFGVSELFDFLRASPALRTIQVKVIADFVPGGVPRETIVLPNVETFSLLVENRALLFDIAAHISCPRAKETSLMYEIDEIDITPELDMFPTSVSWNAIAHQYTASPVDEVILEIQPGGDPLFALSLTFRSSDATVITLGFQVLNTDEEDDGESQDKIGCEIFCQASRIIRNHPLLHNAKRLQIRYEDFILDDDRLERVASEFGRLFELLGPLDVLSIGGYDPRSYLAPFLDDGMAQSIVYPPIKEFEISKPWIVSRREECLEAIVELAKSQHTRGMPFESLTVSLNKVPTTMAERLRPWVGKVDCH
jgi:hypothetical protein